MKNLYFTKSLAEMLCNDYQFLKGELVPHQFEPVFFKDVILVEINKDEYDVVLVSDVEPLEISQDIKPDVQRLTSMRLLDYFDAYKVEFNYAKYGIGYAKITSEKDKDGIDLYL